MGGRVVEIYVAAIVVGLKRHRFSFLSVQSMVPDVLCQLELLQGFYR